MKRLHLVGKSRDNRRLVLARTKGAKFGSFDVAISPKLLKLVREVEETRAAKSGGTKERASKPEERASGAKGPQVGLFGQVTGLADERATASSAAAQPKPPASGDSGKGARSERPSSRLSPGEIQTLLRAGRSVNAVSKMAEAPVEWVRRLAEPIQLERAGVVQQLLQARLVRSRLGRSEAPVGPAIVANLRQRGVRFPERVVMESGWTALRENGRHWRVRFTFDHRGRKRRAEWEFDPQHREISSLNQLAAELSWVAPPIDGSPGGAPPERPTRRSPRSSTKRSTTRKRSGATARSRKKASGARRR